MAMTTQHMGPAPHASMAAVLVDSVEAAIDGLRTIRIRPFALLARWQARVTDRRHLAQLDDRLLADMGLNAETADAEAAKPFWRA